MLHAVLLSPLPHRRPSRSRRARRTRRTRTRSRPAASRWEAAPSSIDGSTTRHGRRQGEREHVGAALHRDGDDAVRRGDAARNRLQRRLQPRQRRAAHRRHGEAGRDDADRAGRRHARHPGGSVGAARNRRRQPRRGQHHDPRGAARDGREGVHARGARGRAADRLQGRERSAAEPSGRSSGDRRGARARARKHSRHLLVRSGDVRRARRCDPVAAGGDSVSRRPPRRVPPYRRCLRRPARCRRRRRILPAAT